MKADNAEDQHATTTNNTTTGLKKGERLCQTVKQEIWVKDFEGDVGHGKNQAQGLSHQAEPARPQFSITQKVLQRHTANYSSPMGIYLREMKN